MQVRWGMGARALTEIRRELSQQKAEGGESANKGNKLFRYTTFFKKSDSSVSNYCYGSVGGPNDGIRIVGPLVSNRAAGRRLSDLFEIPRNCQLTLRSYKYIKEKQRTVNSSAAEEWYQQELPNGVSSRALTTYVEKEHHEARTGPWGSNSRKMMIGRPGNFRRVMSKKVTARGRDNPGDESMSLAHFHERGRCRAP